MTQDNEKAGGNTGLFELWDARLSGTLVARSGGQVDSSKIPLVTRTLYFEKGIGPTEAAGHILHMIGVENGKATDAKKDNATG